MEQTPPGIHLCLPGTRHALSVQSCETSLEAAEKMKLQCNTQITRNSIQELRNNIAPCNLKQ